MKYHNSIHAIFGAALIFSTFTGCGDDDPPETTQSTGGPSTDPGSSTSGSTTMVDPSTTTTPGTTTMEQPTTTTIDPTTTTPGTTTVEPSTGDPNGYMFANDPYDAYTQIDRHAAVEAGTAGIRASEGLGFNMGSDITVRDPYNASNPEEDAAMMWLPEIADSITFFHDALDDDIMGLGLVPATFDDSVAQAGPVIIPDTIKYDPKIATGYPNGRTLTDQVVDITLAAVLLKLGGNQPLTTFADLPLNPPANDVPFLKDFPFLAPPHLP